MFQLLCIFVAALSVTSAVRGDTVGTTEALLTAFDLTVEAGIAAYSSEDFIQAISFFDSARSLQPRSAAAAHMKAQACCRLRDLDCADASIQEALALDNTDPNIWNTFGEIHRARGYVAPV